MPYGIRAALRASVQRLGSLPSDISLRLPGRALLHRQVFIVPIGQLVLVMA